MNALAARIVGSRLLPAFEQLRALCVAHDWQVGYRLFGIGYDTAKQRLEVGDHALRGAGFEQIGVVVKPDTQSFFERDGRQGQIDFDISPV